LRRGLRAPRYGRFPAEREFVGKKMAHAAVIHHQQNDIGIGSANLEPNASTFHLHRGGSRPADAIRFAADAESTAILLTDDEPDLLHPRYDDNAFGPFEQVMRNSVIGGVHHAVDCVSRSVKTIGNFDLPVGAPGELQSARQP
jgi:hypothetical protein